MVLKGVSASNTNASTVSEVRRVAYSMCSALVLSRRMNRRRSEPFCPSQLRVTVCATSLAAFCERPPAYAQRSFLRVINAACAEDSKVRRVRCCAALVWSLSHGRGAVAIGCGADGAAGRCCGGWLIAVIKPDILNGLRTSIHGCRLSNAGMVPFSSQRMTRLSAGRTVRSAFPISSTQSSPRAASSMARGTPISSARTTADALLLTTWHR